MTGRETYQIEYQLITDRVFCSSADGILKLFDTIDALIELGFKIVKVGLV